MRHLIGVLFVVAGVCLSAGCSKPRGEVVSYDDLLARMTDGARLARLDVPGAKIVTSYDRSGGNDDFGYFQSDGPTGWKVVADLKGPGYITRFWCTGSKDGTKRFRFYFDGSRTPGFDVSLDEWVGERGDFSQLPLQGYEPYCWFSYLPIPFEKRLLIMEQAPLEGEKLYYQINYVELPKGQSVDSFNGDYLSRYAEDIENVRKAWSDGHLISDDTVLVQEALVVDAQAGETVALVDLDGPAVIRSLALKLNCSDDVSGSEREHLLRELVLNIYWNDSKQASVQVPLGDFFGSMWKRQQYESVYFGYANGMFYNRFPMPFEQNARVELINESKYPVQLEVRVDVETLDAWNSDFGYFHSGWLKSEMSDRGRPHRILKALGKGHYVGCILGVRSFDKSWWVLEGDETIFVDGEQAPSWHGTGLEDYFNGGWYYANALAAPFHGVPYKVPFNIYQYRVHHADPVGFDQSFKMNFERGPNHASPADMESVSFYYLSEPSLADSDLRTSKERQPSVTPLEQHAIMHELKNHELFNDWSGAVDTIDAFVERYPKFPYNAVLLERKQVYLSGTNSIAPGSGLLGVYCNMATYVYLDGKLVAQANNEKAMQFFDVELGDGHHVLAVRSQWRPYPDWVQVALKTHWGIIGTDGSWKVAFNPSGSWSQMDYDDSTWALRGGVWFKGPPMEPYYWLEPNKEVGMTTEAWGIGPGRDWPPEKGFVVYRKEFDIPPAK